MPLPAAWHKVPDVGTTRDQGSGVDACADPQVSGLLWRGQSEHRQVYSLHLREVRRRHIRGLSEEALAASFPSQAHGDCAGQRQIPPCRASQTPALEISRRSFLAVSAAIQSAAGTYRTSLEISPPLGNTQSVLRHTGRSPSRSLNMLRPLENSKLDTSKIMRHYLRRYV